MTTRSAALALTLCASAAHADKLPLKAIEDPTGQMSHFYGALARVKAKQPGAIARVLHYGDSITSNDSVTRRARERLQATFGDGGAGFMPFGMPSPSFRHFTARRTQKGWKVRNVTFVHLADGRYGFGGAAFEGGPGAQSTFSTMNKGELGKQVARFDIYYLIQPKGGTLALEVDGKPAGTIETAGDKIASGFKSVDVPDGEHALTVRVTAGKVRVFGVIMERRGPGITYDNLGLASNSAKSLKGIRADHLREQLDHRGADLIVVYLGTNEADWYSPAAKSMAEYQEVYGELLAGLRAAAPRASCLVMSSTDAAVLTDGKWISKPPLAPMVEAQRKAAAAKGCAFWDSFTWMGGKGSVVKWRRQGDWEPDLIHPNATGAAKVADGLVDALIAGAK